MKKAYVAQICKIGMSDGRTATCPTKRIHEVMIVTIRYPRRCNEKNIVVFEYCTYHKFRELTKSLGINRFAGSTANGGRPFRPNRRNDLNFRGNVTGKEKFYFICTSKLQY